MGGPDRHSRSSQHLSSRAPYTLRWTGSRLLWAWHPGGRRPSGSCSRNAALRYTRWELRGNGGPRDTHSRRSLSSHGATDSGPTVAAEVVAPIRPVRNSVISLLTQPLALFSPPGHTINRHPSPKDDRYEAFPLSYVVTLRCAGTPRSGVAQAHRDRVG